MVSFIDENREKHGVEPICKTLPIAPSTYYERKARDADPDLEPDRTRRDKILKGEVQRIWDDNRKVYGAKKVWKALIKENRFLVARCTVERLMRSMGLRGVIRGKSIRTTFPSPKDERPDDLVNRDFTASSPNKLWVADFTYVSTWQGFVYVAFIIDVFSRMIVGWRASRSMKTDFTLDALNQALWARQVVDGLIHHSDRGSQYLAFRYSDRLTDAGIDPSVGTKGDSYDNAMAETINGLYKAEVIHRRSSWRTIEQVELETLDWVDWYNNRRLMEPLGYISPAEFESMYYEREEGSAVATGLN
jgi:putative transposase